MSKAKETWNNGSNYIPLSAEMEQITERSASLAMRRIGTSFSRLPEDMQDEFRLLRLQALVEAGKRRRRVPTFSVRRAIKYAAQQFGDLIGEQARAEGLDMLVELRGMSK